VGIKHQWNTGHAQATVFRITRPRAGDAGACDVSQSCTLQMDGDDRHQGVELSAREKWGALTLDTSVMWLSAQRRNGHINPSLNGLRPTNVPDWVLRATASYAVPQVPGLSAHVGLSHEGRRAVVPDGSIELPSWSRVATWRMNIKNVFNRRYFQESPYQYSHIYLFPAAPRTVTFGWETAF
jgi:iron complex outermembrane receptor protein